MTPILLRFALLILIVFFVVLLLLRSQPLSNGDLHHFFLPDDCSAPCFMGIQPGVTSATEAYALLAAHPWVAKVDFGPGSFADMMSKPGLIHWTWSGKQPDWIDPSRPGTLTAASGRVDSLVIQSTIPLGAVTLALGAPGSQRIFTTAPSSPSASASYVMVYPESRLWISVGAACPLDPAFELFQQPTLVEWMRQPISNFDPSDRWPAFYQSCS